jgi:hypothetical protein
MTNQLWCDLIYGADFFQRPKLRSATTRSSARPARNFVAAARLNFFSTGAFGGRGVAGRGAWLPGGLVDGRALGGRGGAGARGSWLPGVGGRLFSASLFVCCRGGRCVRAWGRGGARGLISCTAFSRNGGGAMSVG